MRQSSWRTSFFIASHLLLAQGCGSSFSVEDSFVSIGNSASALIPGATSTPSPTPAPSSSSSSLAAIEIPLGQFPEIPVNQVNNRTAISLNGISIGTRPGELGAAISSLKKDGFEYIINEPLSMLNFHRGASLTAAFFFNSPLDPTGTYRTYYNDCNNPIETGSVADFNTNERGIESPTLLYSPSPSILQSRSQLAYYLDPFQNCDPTKINGLTPGVNNARLSSVYMGKTVSIGNIGTSQLPILIPNVVAVDFEMLTSENYTYSNLVLAFASLDPRTLTLMHSFDPRDGSYRHTPPPVRDGVTPEDPSNPSYGPLPVIVSSSDLQHSFALYSPQIPLGGEGSDRVARGYTGYSRDLFPNNVIDIMAYVRRESISAGLNQFKVFFVVGTFNEVAKGLRDLYYYFSVLSPKVFDWQYYTANNTGLSSLSEDQARLHWVTRGIKMGLRASSSFSVIDHLNANPVLKTKFGSNYYQAILEFVGAPKP